MNTCAFRCLLVATGLVSGPAFGQSYEQFDLFPLTLGSSWTYSDGSIARVSQAVEGWDNLTVTITNGNTSVHGPGYLRVYADPSGVQLSGYSQPNYIIYNGQMGFYPVVVRPMSLGRSWNSYFTSNGSPINETQTVTDTNKTITAGSKVYAGCTELTSVVSFPPGYNPGQTQWTRNYYYFLPGVGCVKRVLTSADHKTNVLYATAWDIKDPPREVVITGHPASQYGVTGKAVTFRVQAYGATAVKYQWRKNDTNLVNGGRIAGATSSALTISSLTTNDAGEYSVVVSSAYGSEESEEAKLWIIPATQTFSLPDYFWPMYPGNQWVYDTDGTGSPQTVHRVETDAYAVTLYRGCSPPQPFVRTTARLYGAYGTMGGGGNFTPDDEWWDYPVVEGDTFGQVGYDDNPGDMEMRIASGTIISNRVRIGQSFTLGGTVHINGVCQGQMSMTFAILDYTNVTTSAGQFLPDCLHIRWVKASTGRTEYDDQWWAKGLGMVLKKRKVVKTTETYTVVDELASWSVVSRPRITTPPVGQTNVLGSTASFHAPAIGTGPLLYQWYRDGLALLDDDRIDGADESRLTIPNLLFADQGLYSVVVRNSYGSVTSAPVALVVIDRNPPALDVTSHSDLGWVSTSSLMLQGTASDAGTGDHGIKSVTVNGKAATGGTASGAGLAGWSCLVPLLPNLNTLKVVATDGWNNKTTNILRVLSDTARPTLGFRSPTNTQAWGYSTLLAEGWAKDNAAVTEVRYQLNGGAWLPAQGTTTWTAGLDLVPGANTLRAYAVDRHGYRSITNTVKFTYNPFLKLAGTYYGLFATEPWTHGTSGYLTLTLGTSGAFSGSFLLDGRTHLLSGAFDTDGYAAREIPRTGTNAISVELFLDMEPGSDYLEGTFSNGDWLAIVDADRAVWHSTTNLAAYRGRYTLAIPGGDVASAAEPAGFGYAAITVDSAGKLVASGYLADGTAWSQSTRVSREGWWPLYAPLYSGKGSIGGWLSFTNVPEQDLTGGDLCWVKPALGAKTKYYPQGFTLLSSSFGSYQEVPTNLAVVPVTNLVFWFAGGNLAEPFTNQVVLKPKYAISNASPNKFTATYNPTNGVWTGKVVVPGTKNTNSFRGVILQNRGAGVGHLLGTNQSSLSVLEALDPLGP